MNKQNNFTPKLKNLWRTDATIKVSTFLERTEAPKGCFTNVEKVINIFIREQIGTASSTFPCTKAGKREALNFIRDEVYLK